jgi:hypothetical protein
LTSFEIFTPILCCSFFPFFLSHSRDKIKMATVTATPVLFPVTTENKPAESVAVDVVEVPAEAAVEYEILTVKKKDGTIKKVRRPIKKDAQLAPAPAEAPKGTTENDVLFVTTTPAPAPAPVEAPKPAEPSFVVLTTTTTPAPAPAPVAAAPGKIFPLMRLLFFSPPCHTREEPSTLKLSQNLPEPSENKKCKICHHQTPTSYPHQETPK